MDDKQFKLDLRYLRMAHIWAENSYCKRRQVGCLVVKDKMIISDGYNGTPSGFENVCEDENNVTHLRAPCRGERHNETGEKLEQQRRRHTLRD